MIASIKFVVVVTAILIGPEGLAPDSFTLPTVYDDIGACVRQAEATVPQFTPALTADKNVYGFSADCVAVEPLDGR